MGTPHALRLEEVRSTLHRSIFPALVFPILFTRESGKLLHFSENSFRARKGRRFEGARVFALVQRAASANVP
jgi:hypothetical protein